MDDTTVIQLAKPVSVGEAVYTSVTLTEPTVGQLESAFANAGNSVTTMIVLISQVASIPEAAVRKMSQRDFRACDAFLGRFSASEGAGSTTPQT